MTDTNFEREKVIYLASMLSGYDRVAGQTDTLIRAEALTEASTAGIAAVRFALNVLDQSVEQIDYARAAEHLGAMVNDRIKRGVLPTHPLREGE